MPSLAAPVGRDQPNVHGDVKTVQILLNNVPGLAATARLKEDGVAGPATLKAIADFQAAWMHLSPANGIVGLHCATLWQLSHLLPAAGPVTRRSHSGHRTPDPTSDAAPGPANQAPPTSPGGYGPGGLTEVQYVHFARVLGVEPAAIKAVVQTEVAIRGPFDRIGRPTILFERHLFAKLTQGRFSAANPDISNPKPGEYGYFSEQYPKLERAMALDRVAALQSASWGAFQILGSNHRAAGFNDVDRFVTAMKRDVTSQLVAFVTFVRHSPVILQSLRTKNWASFARHYNGPGYKKYHYDASMSLNYAKFAHHG